MEQIISIHLYRLSIWILIVLLAEVSVPVISRATNLPLQSRLSIESNSIQRVFTESKRIGNSGQTTGDGSRALKRVFLSNRTITCNDGSQAGFYLRKSLKSKRWVVFLEGGWHCYDQKSCRSRWMRLRHLMTSAQWPETRDVGGILASSPTENPYWHDANHVFVPYCSSDSWSGTKIKTDPNDGWSFMGSLIIRQVITDLIPLGLGRSQGGQLLLVGSSAGGLGVMLNLDKVRKYLRDEREIKLAVRGVSDSGWFLDREPYAPDAISAAEVVRQGWKLWEGSLPDACIAKHTSEPWRCYFGHRLYSTLKSPLFVFQWLFDEAQMSADSVGAPVTPQQWDYIHDMGGALRDSLNNVTAVFAPSCIGHAVLTKRDWLNIKIDDISLAEALRCWEQSTTRRGNKELLRHAWDGKLNKKRGRRRKKNNEPSKHRRGEVLDNVGNKNNRSAKNNEKKGKEIKRHSGKGKGGKRKNNKLNLTQEERRVLRLQRKQHKNSTEQDVLPVNPRSERSPLSEITNVSRRNSSLTTQLHQTQKIEPNRSRHGNNRKNRRRNNSNHNRNGNRRQRNDRIDGEINLSVQTNRPNQRTAEPKRCTLRLMERCSWPQCNHSCPTLTNPLTGEEMRFLELLASFGLDIEAVATALGVDMQTLNNMDHTELVNLLTQQVS